MTEDRVPAAEATVCTMLFSWIGGLAEGAQHRHGNHGGGNRGREGQADLQPRIDIGGGEEDRDHEPQQQAADGQFLVLCGQSSPIADSK